MVEPIGCRELFLICDAFTQAAKRTGVGGRVVVPSIREDPADTLELLASQDNDLVVIFGAGLHGLDRAAVRHSGARFAQLDSPLGEVGARQKNALGVVFRTSEAAFIAGWVAGRLERSRPGRDAVGIVGGYPVQAVRAS